MTTIKLHSLNIEPQDDTITLPIAIHLNDDDTATAVYDGSGDVSYPNLPTLLNEHTVYGSELRDEWCESSEDQDRFQRAMQA